MKNSETLRNTLRQIDHKPYPNYKRLKGQYSFDNYILSIDHVQGDPFAAPSKLSICVSGEIAQFPPELYRLKVQKIALEDYLLRTVSHHLKEISFQARGSGKSGLLDITKPGQEILERSSSNIDPANGNVTIHFEAGFPAFGRTINSGELEYMIFDLLPPAVNQSLYYQNLDAESLKRTANLAEDQEFIRTSLRERHLVAFVSNGSILPRETGISDIPMQSPPAVLFKSPETMEIELNLPNNGQIKGMGIPVGVTLIVGGGYHGKSTLLEALQLGVYNHIANDGRTFVITDETAVKIRSEDGRFIKNVDISMFINGLPNGKDTVHFTTDDASGSTSQAAGVIEAIEAGTRLLLIDEDTSATNFMVRDELMERVVARSQEPITPYIQRIRELYEKYGVSSIVVAGSSGSFFHVADLVVQMNQYQPYEITQLAKTEANNFPLNNIGPPEISPSFDRVFFKNKDFNRNDRFKIKVMGTNILSINRDEIDLKYVEQIVDSEQALMLALIVKYVELYILDGKKTLKQAVDIVEKNINEKGFNWLYDDFNRNSRLAVPRRFEIFACLNRFRKL
ncbi:hypothetical protein M9Y10_043358 [Tritrichomonas musculus]|uniref:Isopentenyl-diphosphate delta-isomerase n=1 Tax=Tritrichomonas musculus TaxID=1915356 RepID=A0ABR2JZG4_9EUKA